jgi:hypothetical protein
MKAMIRMSIVLNFLLISTISLPRHHKNIPSFLYTNFCKKSELVLIREWEVRRSYLALVKDSKGNNYIIKQAKSELPAADMFAVRDLIGAYIAEELGIPANRVRIIPAGVEVVGKKFANRPATMHTCIEGEHCDIDIMKKFIKQLKQLKNYYERVKEFSLRQEFAKAVSNDHKGLTLHVIKSMALHESFARIVALDCYLGVSDRGRGNMLYNAKQNMFYFIDFDISYSKDLCFWAARQLTKIMKESLKSLNTRDYRALVIYGKTLQNIVKKYTPEYVNALLEHVCEEAKIKYSPENKGKMDFIRSMSRQSYNSAREVLKILDKLFSHSRVRRQRGSGQTIGRNIFAGALLAVQMHELAKR